MIKQTYFIEGYFLGNANMKNFMNLAYLIHNFDIKFFKNF